ncbi:MAG: hypothetical protein K1X88_00465 [Nannocystaceae bacterium]|nr:hypothetical protein [Nannocystaceae bacterium]
MKAQQQLPRWATVMGSTMLTLVLALAASDEPRPLGSRLGGTATRGVDRHNALSFSTAVEAPRLGVALGYERRIHRFISAGAQLEYAIPKDGYGHLQGLTETVALSLWAPRAFRGFYVQASTSVAESVLAAQPRFTAVTVAPGVAGGLRWRFGRTFFIGAQLGLRWAMRVRNDTAVCTHAVACPATRTGPVVRAAFDVGFTF